MRSGLFAADALRQVLSGSVPEDRAWRRYEWNCRRTFTPGFLVGHTFRGAVKAGLLDAVASGFDHPRVRRMATWAIGSALSP